MLAEVGAAAEEAAAKASEDALFIRAEAEREVLTERIARLEADARAARDAESRAGIEAELVEARATLADLEGQPSAKSG